jgi:eukaryotic-like serine/threonine-protein kinase
VSASLQQLRTYQLQACVGRSSRAEVWKAFDLQSQHSVALKIFQTALQHDPGFMTRFWNLPFSPEAQKVLALHHPQIVHIHSFQISRPSEAEHPLAYVVMDYVDGPTLAEYLRDTSSKRVFPPATALVQLFAALGAAIDYAHQQGVIHGAIKPTNILLDTRHASRNPMGEPLLADSGMTQLLGTSTGALGHLETDTACYLSPEQVLGHPANERSDLYALGVILYELCTGERPFRGKDEQEIMMQHLNTALPSPTLLNPALSPALAAVIERSLEKEPAKRFSSAATLLTALVEALQVPLLEHPSQPDYPSTTLNGQTDLSSAAPALPDQAWSDPPEASGEGQAHPDATIRLPKPSGVPLADSGEERTHPDATIRLPKPPRVPSSHPGVTDQSSPVTSASANSREATPTALSGSTESSVASQTPNPSPAPSEIPPAPLAPFPTPQTPEPPPGPPTSQRGRGQPGGTGRKALIIVLLMLLVVSTFSALFLLTHRSPTPTATPPLVGQVYFLSSGRLYVNNNQGINDEVLIDLHNLAAPAPGNSYYAWLLGDTNQSDVPWIFLGKVGFTQGNVTFLYPGDQAHTNLLNDMSRFLLTDQDATTSPTNPLLDQSSWRYVGQIDQTPSVKDPNHFSLLDHLRHLLVQAPELKVLGLPGGLGIWLVRNVEEIAKWALVAKESWEVKRTDVIRQYLVNILYYLDGECTQQADLQGLPPRTPTTPENQTIAHIAHFALLNPCIQEEQEQANALKKVFQHVPHNYVDHLLFHMAGVIQSPGATSQSQALALQLNTAINTVKTQLLQVRQDAEQALHLTDTQLRQQAALDLLSDLQIKARYAYAGRTDPTTGNVQQGATWIFDNVERLAAFAVTPFSSH